MDMVSSLWVQSSTFCSVPKTQVHCVCGQVIGHNALNYLNLRHIEDELFREVSCELCLSRDAPGTDKRMQMLTFQIESELKYNITCFGVCILLSKTVFLNPLDPVQISLATSMPLILQPGDGKILQTTFSPLMFGLAR